ncbi:renierapurpurin 18,18'-hydroxylase [Azospirillaceae bacterium]
MLDDTHFFLRNIWYYAMPGHKLRAGAMVGRTLLNEPILFARQKNGDVFAIRDICPHRGIPLSSGRFDGEVVECRYHGWLFDQKGCCAEIPSLVPGQDFDIAKVRVRSYPCRELDGNIWIYMEDQPGASEPPIQDIPRVPEIGQRGYQMAETMNFPCYVDHAVIGLMDPAHGPFVHRSWYWRNRRSIHEKAKLFGPVPHGFQMRRHKPSKNSAAYKLLGGIPETEITFRLPGVRIEHIQTGRHTLVNLTAVTPINEQETEINHIMYWTLPWLTLGRPILRRFAKEFLAQDRDAVVEQKQGLKYDPSLMLIKDADVQARWYFQLKNEWARSQAEGRAFVNPVKDIVLRWRS